MHISSYLVCPSCHTGRLRDAIDSVICDQCEHYYPVILGIIDFRDVAVDGTAGFSIDADRILAAQLGKAFGKLQTFNELHDVFLLLRNKQNLGLDISKIDLDDLVCGEKILPHLMRADQLVHGHAILDKVFQYIKSTSYQAPARNMALENGCGLGFFIDGFAANFKSVAVLDFSLAYLILAQKIVEERRLNNVFLVCGSVERLPFSADTFDFVHSNNVIEHVTCQNAMFAEAKRVTSNSGLFFVLSPNRFSVYFEPHFRLPLYGFIPLPVRRKLIRIWQRRDINEVSLRSLSELRELASLHFGGNSHVSFIPRHMARTVTGGLIRNLLVWCLNQKILGAATNLVINKIFLGIMPYHVLLCFKRPKFK